MPHKEIFRLKFSSDRGAAPLGLARSFAATHREALLNASHLLGGPQAHVRCMKLLRKLKDAPVLTRRLRMELVELHKLLMLDRVGEPESVESVCFAEIDPSDPIVGDLCYLADQVNGLLFQIDEASENADCRAQSLPEENAA